MLWLQNHQLDTKEIARPRYKENYLNDIFLARILKHYHQCLSITPSERENKTHQTHTQKEIIL